MYRFLLLACLFAAPLAFAGGLALMQPQIAALQALEGPDRFLRSLALEPDAWRDSHILLSLAALLYIGAALATVAKLGPAHSGFGTVIGALLIAGFAALLGNFALDFVYGALATTLDESAAIAARNAVTSDFAGQLLFTQIAPALMLAGMLVLALTALITNWLPRLTGVFIIGGWAIVIGLNATLPYAEVIGHLVIGLGFWTVAMKTPDEA
jgi:hypothetical protein